MAHLRCRAIRANHVLAFFPERVFEKRKKNRYVHSEHAEHRARGNGIRHDLVAGMVLRQFDKGDIKERWLVYLLLDRRGIVDYLAFF